MRQVTGKGGHVEAAGTLELFSSSVCRVSVFVSLMAAYDAFVRAREQQSGD